MFYSRLCEVKIDTCEHDTTQYVVKYSSTTLFILNQRFNYQQSTVVVQIPRLLQCKQVAKTLIMYLDRNGCIVNPTKSTQTSARIK